VWSCQTASELLIPFQSFAVALAKSQDHREFYGVFAFGGRTPHDSRASEWMARSRTPHTDTPRCKMWPALVNRLVKHKVTQVET